MASINAATALEIQDKKFAELGFEKDILGAEHVCTYRRSLQCASESNPVLVLLHGYPQSSHMWRHLITCFGHNRPVFAADLPGYGASAPIAQNDKLSVGMVVLEALKTAYMQDSGCEEWHSDVPALLLGHDRGARVAHRLAVSGHEGVDIKGLVLVDIVPTLTHHKSFSNPSASTSSFHWPFLANATLATQMIITYGGDKWALDMLTRWRGTSATAQANLAKDNAIAVYTGFFSNPSVIRASCLDYEAGATVDVSMQLADQDIERKQIKVPVLLIWSEEYLGKRFNLLECWREWVEGPERLLEGHGIGRGVGHFGVEEAPGECWGAVRKWMEAWGWGVGRGDGDGD